jgi:thermostable 8-oxoguanine DNA glycosylase
MYTIVRGQTRSLHIPAPHILVLPGLQWGAFDTLLTPAFWRGQAWQCSLLGWYSDLRLGRTLTEEVIACVLGGYGMPAELGIAAFSRLRDDGLLHNHPDFVSIRRALSTPFLVGKGERRYRFPQQKARYVAACLEKLQSFQEPDDDLKLRDRLASLPGVGLKTASWITRNYRNSNKIAIIDIHILRVGRILQLFPADWTPIRHYRKLEERFLAFANAIETPAGLLDGVMWDHLRRLPLSVINARPAVN